MRFPLAVPPTQETLMPSTPRPRTNLAAHRAHMLVDVLAKGPKYRKLLKEACKAFDEAILRDKERPKGRPRKHPNMKPIHIPKSARAA